MTTRLQYQFVSTVLLFLYSNTPVWAQFGCDCYDSNVAYGGFGLFFGFIIGLIVVSKGEW